MGKMKKKFDYNHFMKKDISWWDPDEEDPFMTNQNRMIFDIINVPTINNILEIGIGRGRLSGKVKNLGKDIIGIDINLEFVKYCKKRHKAIDFLNANVVFLPFYNHSFDCVLCIETFMHLPEPQKSLQEMDRVLRPNGYLILNFLRKYSEAHKKLMVSRVLRKYKSPVDFRHDTFKDIEKYIRGSNLEIQETFMEDSSVPLAKLIKKST